MKYSHLWDLSTIPQDLFKQEEGRRRRACGPAATNQKLQLCANCRSVELNATQRRKPCPGCGYRHPQ